MSERVSLAQAIADSNTEAQEPLNKRVKIVDLNNADRGDQDFVYKKILDAGVATAIGSPTGTTSAAGASTVTPDQSDSGSGAGILGSMGGVAQFAVAAGTTAYGWVQYGGVGRTILKTTGALAAAALGVWSGDDTVAAFTDPGNEELIAFYAVVAASGGEVAAGNWVKIH